MCLCVYVYVCFSVYGVNTLFSDDAQIFDAIIIGSSFAIDIVFLGGVAGEEGQKAAAVLVVLLLWRIARVVDGMSAHRCLSFVLYRPISIIWYNCQRAVKGL